MRARPDVQLVVLFLTQKMQASVKDNWGKLKNCLKYLKGTLYTTLDLIVYSLSIIHWWVDAAYGVHWDCKGHTGAMISMGTGVILSFLRARKLIQLAPFGLS